jgi:hypothetical protein
VSYQPGTILTRKELKKLPDGSLDPFNEVKVIGPSPVSTGVRSEEFTGQQGEAISIQPTSFGPTIDKFFGELQSEYDVTSIPEPPAIQAGTVTPVSPGPTPEEQFAQAARAQREQASDSVTAAQVEVPAERAERAAAVAARAEQPEPTRTPEEEIERARLAREAADDLTPEQKLATQDH